MIGKVVIIEPHWNLKLSAAVLFFFGLIVIIEPHWNLKVRNLRKELKENVSNNRTTLESKAEIMTTEKTVSTT